MSKFRFAIMGAASIAEKFCDAVRLTDDCEVIAVAGKNESRLIEFAARQGIPKYYVGYEELLKNERPDCIYIAAVTSLHYELTMMCLSYGVPVLCEKAMFTTSKEAETAFALAKEKGVFTMEAMWSRFLPAMQKAKQWVDEGRIGTVRYVDARLGFAAGKDPKNRFYNPELGGGAAYDLGVYAYELSTFMLGEDVLEIKPEVIWSDTGVDICEHVTLRFENAIASLGASLSEMMEERLVISGDKGLIIVPLIHFAHEAYLYDSNRHVVEHFVDDVTKNGFVYEVMEAAECVREGRLESDTVPHLTTIRCCRMFDEILKTRK